MIKFQYISDLHLEYYKNLNFENINFEKINGCDNLFLLGDIGCAYSDIYHEFIQYCSENWKNVFVIFGNHEYFCKKQNIKTMEEIEKEVLKFPKNVYYLQNDYIYINKHNSIVTKNINEENCNDYIKIIGSILWSNINEYTASCTNDYKYIYITRDKLLMPDDVRKMFKINREYILKEIESSICSTILLTHHGVHDLANGYYNGNQVATGYVTNIVELSNMRNLIACINGHTHSSIDTKIPNTNIKLLSNCYGYKGENQRIVNYRKNVMLEINSEIV